MRRILLLLFLLAVSVSATANVSLGEIEVRSFLNQPLQAQFRVQGSTLAGAEVEFRVASEDAYRRAGLLRTAVPADLNISVEGSGTTRTVRLTTMRPVREPYLGLLLEARWPAGRVLREYTILLDPPVAFAPERSAPPVITRAPEPVVREAPAPAPAPVARSERPASPASRYSVRRGDTLSSIVRRQGYSGVTDQQAMLAILDANPNAFVDGNMNQLRAGVELRLPTQSEVAAYRPEEALQEFRRQNAEWRGQVAPPVVAQPAPEPAREPAAEVVAEPEVLPAVETPPEAEPTPGIEPVAEAETVAPADERVAVEPEPVPEPEPLATEVESPADRLEILSEGEFDPAVVAGGGTQIIEEAMLAQQAAMRELRDELNTLRTELVERDQLIRVMNTELAQLEARMQNLREQPDEGAPGHAADTPLHTRLLSDPLLMLLSATSLLLFLLLLLAVFRSRGREAAAETPTIPAVTEDKSRAEPVVATADPAPKAPAKAATAATAATAAAAATVTGVKSSEDEQADTSTPASPETPARKEAGGNDAKVEDILADVDLYLAYGMNDQAITALEKAIRGGQDDPEYRVRLIEAYAANGDGVAAHREADTLLEGLEPGQQAVRERVEAALATVPVTDTDAGLDVPGLDPEAMDVAAPEDAATQDAQRQPDAAGSDDDKPDDNMLEFDLGEEEATTTVAGTSATDTAATPDADREAEEADPGLLRFDLDDVDADSPAERPPADEKDDGKGQEEGFPELTLPDLEPLEPLEQPASPAQEAPAQSMTDTDGDTSENGMKLSLAEAFVEMGDREGAIALLDEILPTATDAQRAKVEALRRQIEDGVG